MRGISVINYMTCIKKYKIVTDSQSYVVENCEGFIDVDILLMYSLLSSSELSFCEGISMVVSNVGASSVGESSEITDDVVSLVIEVSLSFWILELVSLHDGILVEESTYDASDSAL